MDLFSLGDGLVHSVFIGKLIFSHAKENYVKNFKNLLSKKNLLIKRLYVPCVFPITYMSAGSGVRQNTHPVGLGYHSRPGVHG